MIVSFTSALCHFPISFCPLTFTSAVNLYRIMQILVDFTSVLRLFHLSSPYPSSQLSVSASPQLLISLNLLAGHPVGPVSARILLSPPLSSPGPPGFLPSLPFPRTPRSPPPPPRSPGSLPPPLFPYIFKDFFFFFLSYLCDSVLQSCVECVDPTLKCNGSS